MSQSRHDKLCVFNCCFCWIHCLPRVLICAAWLTLINFLMAVLLLPVIFSERDITPARSENVCLCTRTARTGPNYSAMFLFRQNPIFPTICFQTFSSTLMTLTIYSIFGEINNDSRQSSMTEFSNLSVMLSYHSCISFLSLQRKKKLSTLLHIDWRHLILVVKGWIMIFKEERANSIPEPLSFCF